MINVLIAEDEPAAARYLKSLVELLGPEFAVVALAAHGEEALELVRRHRPDLVLTDVRMPVLDGIGLLGRLRDEFPDLPTVIVSGYQEFAYARQALALGVADYLLKPVSPSELHRLLNDLAGRIHERKNRDSLTAITDLLAGRQGGRTPARFLAALVRWGGLATRPTSPPVAGSTSGPGFWVLPGRDARESLALADADLVSRDQFEVRVRELPRPERILTSTQAFTERAIGAGELVDTVRDLGLWVDRLLVYGRTKSHWGPVDEALPAVLDPVWTQKLRLAQGEAAYHKLESLVRSLVATWDKERLSAQQQARLLRQVLLSAQQQAPDQGGLRDWEFLLDDALGRVDSSAELADVAWSLFSGVAGLGSVPSGPTDAPETHQRIRRFVRTHYTEPLSIPLICDRFQLSQTSLSKLFRKYEGCTFHDYLTGLRLDAAEALLNDSPGLPLKTVASAVGYQDPFHFSRAFKAAKGRPPSQRASDAGNSIN